VDIIPVEIVANVSAALLSRSKGRLWIHGRVAGGPVVGAEGDGALRILGAGHAGVEDAEPGQQRPGRQKRS